MKVTKLLFYTLTKKFKKIYKTMTRLKMINSKLYKRYINNFLKIKSKRTFSTEELKANNIIKQTYFKRNLGFRPYGAW